MRLNLINILVVCTMCLLLATRLADAKGRGSARSFSAPKSSYKKTAVIPIYYHHAPTRHHGHRNEEENNCTFYQKYFLGRTNCKKTK